jgi:octaprenyl-diphosphate synthase
MQIAAAVSSLELATTAAGLGDSPDGAPGEGARAAARLAQVRGLLEHDMRWVEAELARHASSGLEPATSAAKHLLEAGGKRVRPLAVLLSAACFGEIGNVARELAVVAELVHLATLLHDDVIDDGSERRGVVAARRVWGNAVSVLAGDLLLTHALSRTSAVASHATLMDLLQTLRLLVDGEVVQLRGRTSLDASEETYFRIARDKTASLFGWAMRAGASCAGAPSAAVSALSTFGEELGVAFQLVDDVLDYAGDPKATGKALLGDLREGKLTLPLVRALNRGAARVDDVAACREGDARAAARLAVAVRSSGACEQVRALAAERTRAALDALERVPPCYARSLLARVATELTSRAS